MSLLLVPPVERYSQRSSRWFVDSLAVSRLEAARHVLDARAAHPEAHFTLLAALRGSVRGRTVDHGFEFAESGIVILDCRQETVVDVDEQALVIVIPANAVGPYGENLRAALGAPIALAGGPANLVTHLLRALAEDGGGWAPEIPGRLAQHLVGLVGLLCAESAAAAPSPKDAALSGAKHYIERHLADIDLSPDRVARTQNVSTRTLHRLFESEGLTISGWVRERRLERCRMELSDATFDQQSVSMIGARWGLWDAAHFSRVFKARYGMSPRAFRASVARAQLVARA